MPNLLVKSSSGGTYDVSVTFAESRLIARCGCKAGVSGLVCKHVLALLRGDSEILADVSQVPELNEVAERAARTELADLCKAISMAEREIEAAQNKLRKLKNALLESLK